MDVSFANAMGLSTETERFSPVLPQATPRIGIVIGPPRSGTTLVGSMLARGRGVLSLSEPLLAWSIFGAWRRRKFLRRVVREAGLQPAAPPRKTSECEFRDWLIERARASGRKVVVQKETFRGGVPWAKWNNAAQIERLLEPRSGESRPRVVAIVRDPYAAAASTVRLCAPLLGYRGGCIRLVWPVLPKFAGVDDVVRSAALNWAAFAAWLARYAPPLVRYEELVARPREVLEQICAALEIPFDEAMFDSNASGRAVGLGDNDVLQGSARVVDSASLTRGDELTAAQRAIVREACGGAAQPLGYSLDR
jgi:hypothetical protein